MQISNNYISAFSSVLHCSGRAASAWAWNFQRIEFCGLTWPLIEALNSTVKFKKQAQGKTNKGDIRIASPNIF